MKYILLEMDREKTVVVLAYEDQEKHFTGALGTVLAFCRIEAGRQRVW